MKTTALVTHSASPYLTPSDMLLVAPLTKEGIHAIAVPWDDPKIDWKQFDVIVLRSSWEYYKIYDKFLSWLTHLEQIRANVWNPIEVIKQNSQKTYLRVLQKKGIAIPPTLWIKKNENASIKNIMTDTGWRDIVIKPVVGAGSYKILRIQNPNNILSRWMFHRLIKENDCMVQPFMPEIKASGEYSFIYIDGAFSHAVHKLPTRGEFRSNDPKTHITLIKPIPSLMKQASHVISTIHADTLYARVDMINQNGTLVLMEAELIEPILFFDLYPPAATAFAKALKKRLQ